jgi:hypothetical protein
MPCGKVFGMNYFSSKSSEKDKTQDGKVRNGHGCLESGTFLDTTDKNPPQMRKESAMDGPERWTPIPTKE